MAQRYRIPVVEIAVVVVIIAILAALLMPATQSARKAARIAADSAALRDSATGSPASEESRAVAQYVNFQQTQSVSRKIIYEAQVSLIVDDLTETEAEITELITRFGGYVADSSVDRSAGEYLSGRWQVRIPTEHFDAFLDAVSKFGIPERRQQTAQDVTEEFVDLEARIANKKRLEERIAELLRNTSSEIKAVIEVERELARVRGEIEQMEGRLRFLMNRTELTTVTIVAREERDYVPPKVPNLTSRVARAWNDSLSALRGFGERLLVATVYLFPWFVVLGVLVVPSAWYIKRRTTAVLQQPDGSTETRS